MQFDAWTFALQAANFLVLVWLLQRFLYKPVQRAMAERKAATDKLVADVEAQKGAAEALRADLERRRADISEERDQALKAARDAAEAERDAILAKAREAATAANAAAEKAFARERDEAVRQIGQDAAKLAVASLQRLLRETPGAAVQSQMIDLALGDALALPDEAKHSIAERLATLGQRPQVITATALDDAARQSLATRLGAALGAAVAPQFSVEPSLLAGVEIHFPYTILKRSWSQDLARIETELSDDDGAQKRA